MTGAIATTSSTDASSITGVTNAGATGATYTLTPDDLNTSISVRMTGTKSGLISSAQVSSEAVTVRDTFTAVGSDITGGLQALGECGAPFAALLNEPVSADLEGHVTYIVP